MVPHPRILEIPRIWYRCCSKPKEDFVQRLTHIGVAETVLRSFQRKIHSSDTIEETAFYQTSQNNPRRNELRCSFEISMSRSMRSQYIYLKSQLTYSITLIVKSAFFEVGGQSGAAEVNPGRKARSETFLKSREKRAHFVGLSFRRHARWLHGNNTWSGETTRNTNGNKRRGRQACASSRPATRFRSRGIKPVVRRDKCAKLNAPQRKQ